MRFFCPFKKHPEHLKTGLWGETRAARFLRRKGYRILARRVRVGRDEIDLIVRQKKTLIFVEVKTRASEKFGRPVTAIDTRKRHSLQRAAMRYLMKMRRRPDYVRIDAVEVIGKRGDKKPEIRHLENILTLKRYQLPQSRKY